MSRFIDTEKVKELWGKSKLPSLYLSISLFATLLDVGLLVVFIEIFHLYYILSASLSYLTGMVTKFTLNKLFVFRKRPGAWSEQFLRFVTVSVNGLLLTNIFMFIGVDHLDLDYLFSKLITIGLVFIYTATLHNFFSFSRRVKK
ncbi:MAG: GtrA family protein [Candidatus Kariarchaeaceae archaeon]|jgi:putative flippase GtrA